MDSVLDPMSHSLGQLSKIVNMFKTKYSRLLLLTIILGINVTLLIFDIAPFSHSFFTQFISGYLFGHFIVETLKAKKALKIEQEKKDEPEPPKKDLSYFR